MHSPETIRGYFGLDRCRGMRQISAINQADNAMAVTERRRALGKRQDEAGERLARHAPGRAHFPHQTNVLAPIR